MATTKGVADEHILKNDTTLFPVSQFSFPAATTKKKYGGNNKFLLVGVVTNATESAVNTKFVGDTQVFFISPCRLWTVLPADSTGLWP
jgi:hypothetical protein